MAEQHRCYQELVEHWCREVGKEAGPPCPSAQACLLLRELYDTKELDTRQYYSYLKQRMALEWQEALPRPLVAAAA